MSDPKHTFFEDAHWFRLILMLIYWVLLPFAQFFIGCIAIVQAIIAIFTTERSKAISSWAANVAKFIYQANLFLTYRTEKRPFPFSDWPTDNDE